MAILRKTSLAALLFPILGFLISGSLAQTGADMTEVRRLLAVPDFQAARRLLEPLAAAGNAEAMAELGALVYLGRGGASEEARAHALLVAAAEQGSPAAMFWLGRMALLGDGPEGRSADADRNAALWFFKAAQRGHADAQYHLGLLLLAGTGVRADRDEAMKWIGRAAALGHPSAQDFRGAEAPEKPSR